MYPSTISNYVVTLCFLKKIKTCGTKEEEEEDEVTCVILAYWFSGLFNGVNDDMHRIA